MTDLSKTPLFARHEALGGRMVPFAGFSMPVQYSSILEEHAAAREAVALFDVSHMGQLHLEGPGAAAFADRLCSRRMSSLAEGRVRYALLCNEAGGVVDDVTVYRTGSDAFLVCVNASNIDKDRGWCEQHAPSDVTVRDASTDTGLLALQGPACLAVLGALSSDDWDAVKRFRFAAGRVADVAVLASRTGYTGADGFELYCAAADVGALWDALLDAGSDHGLRPAGLGARDTLRLEAALALYGQELDDTTTPYEAGLDRFVELTADGEDRDFLGADALRHGQADGPRRRLVGFTVQGRGIARHGYPIVDAGAEIGRVTSGAPSPTLGQPIGLGYVPPERSAVGTRLTIAVRQRELEAEVVPLPFVSGKTAGRPASPPRT
ncbi:MAG: glycine cleavage system aminomethyltransferase GcvT [Myxococcota bacterium]